MLDLCGALSEDAMRKTEELLKKVDDINHQALLGHLTGESLSSTLQHENKDAHVENKDALLDEIETKVGKALSASQCITPGVAV